jgi:predicted ferric reductase
MLSTDPCRLPVFIEGPYGTYHEFDMLPSVLFIAGGVAVTYTMSNLMHLVQQKSKNPKMRVQQIHHIWVIKELNNMEWIANELEKISELNIPNDFLKMSFFISHGLTNDQIASCGPKVTNMKIEMFAGRANVPGMIAKEVEERLGTLAVVGMDKC